jgi:phosphoserine phosphatase RsbU/P
VSFDEEALMTTIETASQPMLHRDARSAVSPSPGETGPLPDAARELFWLALLEDDATALYEGAPCGYLSTHPDGTIVKVNETFLALTGYERADLVGCRSFASLVSLEAALDHPALTDPRSWREDRIQGTALDLVIADGSRLPVLVDSVLERDGGGAPRVVRTAVFDATERQAHDRELVEAKERAERSEAHARLVARTLQLTLIPHADPEITGLDVASSYRPADVGDEIGGDFYDVFEAAPDDWIVMVGDVCGKGAAAATVAAVARFAVRGAAVRQRSPAEILGVLNQVLLQHDSDRFCTAVVIRLRRAGTSWRGSLCIAGHPPPLFVASGDRPGAVGVAGPLLGVFAEANFVDTEFELGASDVMVLFTDGVTEGRRDGDFYGDDRLRSIVHAAADRPAAELVERVTSEVLEFQRQRPRDDIVVVAVRNPAGPER